MRRRLLVAVVCAGLAFASPATVLGDVSVGPGGGTPGTMRDFQLVGHNPLFNRGMNSALAISGQHVYIGNRSDGSTSCGDFDPGPGVTPVLPPTNPDGSCTHVHPGILVVDVANPASPNVVGEFGTEFVSGANSGQTTRELRVWPAQGLLMVMYLRCNQFIHACPQTEDNFSIRFFDLAANPVNPPLIATYSPSEMPHEMYLWIDPKDSNRALLWLSTPTTSADPASRNLIITDISKARQGIFSEIAGGNWNQFFPGAENPANYGFDLSLHSMTPSVDGTKTYLAHLRGGFGVLDTSKIANNQVPAGTVESLNDDLLTPVPFPTWGMGARCPGHTATGCAESHSAVPFPGRPFVFMVDEVYGSFPIPSWGWPWGWARVFNVAQPKRPHMIGEYKIFQNTEAFRSSVDPATELFTSYSSHNPTLTRNLALDSWHSGGLQAIDIEDPGHPTQAGWFSPTPLATVALEDPALSRGPNKVVMWSYPIIRDGLIYVVDIRNGLYVLKYKGSHADEVHELSFLEGNSNLGDAVRIDKSGGK